MRRTISILSLVAMALLLGRGEARAQNVESYFSSIGPNPYDYYPYDEENYSPYVASWFFTQWDTTYWCGVDGGCFDIWCDADDMYAGIASEDVYAVCPGQSCPSSRYPWNGPLPSDGWFEMGAADYYAPTQMITLHYEGWSGVHWSGGGGEFTYSNYSSDSVTVEPLFQGCGNDAKNRLMQEYRIYPVQSDITPECAWFTNSRQTALYSFNDLNSSPYPYALLRDPLIAPASSGHGLDKWMELAGYGAVNINSGYRSPAHNASPQVGGAPHSKHMLGEAADMNSRNVYGEPDYSIWQTLILAAWDANADWIEDQTYPCSIKCAHADWRFTSGGYQ